jgi:hypothetical protein
MLEHHRPDFALIYVPNDPTEDIMLDGMKQQGMVWPTVAYNKRHDGMLDTYRFGSLYVPHLVLVDQDGTLLADSFHDVNANPWDLPYVFDKINDLVLNH